MKMDNTLPPKPLPQASSSDDDNSPWEHGTTRPERDNVTIIEELDTDTEHDLE